MFTFNGINFSTLVKVQEVKRPLLAPQAITTSSSTGVAGTKFIRKTPQAFNISVTFTIEQSSPSNLRSYIRDIADKLDTDKPAPLVFHDEYDKYIMAILADESELEQLIKYGVCTVNFYCHDPYWYALEDDIIEFTGEEHTFTRKGNAQSNPVFEITGTCEEGGKITIEAGEQSMTFSGTLAQGETLIIDSELLTAKVIGTETRSAINDLNTLEFITLNKGGNTIKISTENATVTKTKITCNSRWK